MFKKKKNFLELKAIMRTKNYLFTLFNAFDTMISGILAISFWGAVYHALFKSLGGI